MKRVINGATYNTDTSARVARWEFEDEKGYDVEATLYRTRGGAWFAVYGWETEPDEWRHRFEAMSDTEVQQLVVNVDDLQIIDESALQAPPEAEAEDKEPMATLYVRMPSTLKHRVDDAAKKAKLSANAWAMRCMERCLAA